MSQTPFSWRGTENSPKVYLSCKFKDGSDYVICVSKINQEDNMLLIILDDMSIRTNQIVQGLDMVEYLFMQVFLTCHINSHDLADSVNGREQIKFFFKYCLFPFYNNV